MAYGNKDSSKAEILIIDDVEMNREILREIISDMGRVHSWQRAGNRLLKCWMAGSPSLF